MNKPSQFDTEKNSIYDIFQSGSLPNFTCAYDVTILEALSGMYGASLEANLQAYEELLESIDYTATMPPIGLTFVSHQQGDATTQFGIGEGEPVIRQNPITNQVENAEFFIVIDIDYVRSLEQGLQSDELSQNLEHLNLQSIVLFINMVRIMTPGAEWHKTLPEVALDGSNLTEETSREYMDVVNLFFSEVPPFWFYPLNSEQGTDQDALQQEAISAE